MKEYLFAFRSAHYSTPPTATPEEAAAMTQKWMDWVGGIAAQGKLASRGNRLQFGGKVVKPNAVITDGPYTEIKEALGGFIVVKTDSLEDAAEIAKGCPILTIGGNVEVREMITV